MKTIYIFLVSIIFAGMAFAQPWGGKGKMMDQLKLTDQQKDKIETLKSENQRKMIDLKADLQKAKADMHDLVMKGNYSRSDFLGAVDKIAKAKEQIAKQMANHRMDVYEQLNPDQKKTFDKMHHRMGKGKGMMMRRGMMGHKGPGGMGMGPNGQGMK
jgi:Spy/CpxP family protein refolding chaperone